MRIHVIRSSKSTAIGVLLTWRERDGAIGAIAVPEADRELWRICESCKLAEADVWCRSHSLFLCRGCIPMHDIGHECDLLSRAAARAITEKNLCR